MTSIAIIPARSGSKGLIHKNITAVNGKPLITYTLEAAVNSGVFDEVMVSTDSEEYARIARSTPGVNVPFLRDPENSGDTASTWAVVKEVLEKYKARGKTFDMCCVLQPTSPLRDAGDIQEAYALYQQKNAYSIVSVCELGHPLNICNMLPEDLSLVGFMREQTKYARQMNPTPYRLNGAIYMCDVEAFLKYDTIYKEKSYAYIMSERKSVDIDTEDDIAYVEFLMNRNQK